MRQKRFEFWLIFVGALVVVASVAIVGGEMPTEELVAQIMLYAIFVTAVYGGKSSGLVAALTFSVVYVAIRAGFRSDGVPLNSDLIPIILVRIVTFSMVGLIVGEMAARLRKRFGHSKEVGGIDPVSRGYNERLVTSALAMAIAESQRYAVPFSVTLIRMTFKPTKSRSAIRQEDTARRISDAVRSSTRVLDRFGRTNDGTLVLISPNTTSEQVEVVKARLEQRIQEAFGEQIEELSIRSLSAPERIEAILEYHQGLERSCQS